ncbi:hypothetical protein D9M72_448920 [compost metagenome]
MCLGYGVCLCGKSLVDLHGILIDKFYDAFTIRNRRVGLWKDDGQVCVFVDFDRSVNDRLVQVAFYAQFGVNEQIAIVKVVVFFFRV